MPVYVYRNLKTGETFDLAQRITEGALSAHPETGDPVKRLIQPVGIAFKGSGFYVTDSRSASNAAAKNQNGAANAGKNGTHDKQQGEQQDKQGDKGQRQGDKGEVKESAKQDKRQDSGESKIRSKSESSSSRKADA